MTHIESDDIRIVPWQELAEAPSAAAWAQGGLGWSLSPHTCNPFPALRCQVGSSAQERSKYDTGT